MFKISFFKDELKVCNSIFCGVLLLFVISSCGNDKLSKEELLVGERWILTKVYLGKDRKQKWGKLNKCNRMILRFNGDSTYVLEDNCPTIPVVGIVGMCGGVRSSAKEVWYFKGRKLKIDGFIDFQLIKLDDHELVMKSDEPGRRFTYYFTNNKVMERDIYWKQVHRLSFKDNSKHLDKNCFFTQVADTFFYHKNGKLVYHDIIRRREDFTSETYLFEHHVGDRLTFNADTAKLIRFKGDGDTEIFVRKWRNVEM